MDDLGSSDSESSALPAKCPRLIIDTSLPSHHFKEMPDKDDLNDLSYTHLTEITDLRHESLNQLLKNNMEMMKSDDIELKLIGHHRSRTHSQQPSRSDLNNNNGAVSLMDCCRDDHINVYRTHAHDGNDNGASHLMLLHEAHLISVGLSSKSGDDVDDNDVAQQQFSDLIGDGERKARNGHEKVSLTINCVICSWKK